MPTYTPAQQKANRLEWIEALRSGQYEQGSGNLKQIRSSAKELYCCLGVLCDVSNLKEWFATGDMANTFKYGDVDLEEGLVPPEVRDWAGLTEYAVDWDSVHFEESLAAKNDDKGWSFEQIADWLESEPEGVING